MAARHTTPRRTDLRRSPRHLLARFLTSVRSHPLTPREQAEAAALLRDTERTIFWGQPALDQRHGLESARHVLQAAPGRRDLARAALLHDVGKRHGDLGVVGRSLASAAAIVGTAPGRRARAYLEHAARGAEDLAAAGAEPLVVTFARHHHGARPASIAEGDWELLQAADHA